MPTCLSPPSCLLQLQSGPRITRSPTANSSIDTTPEEGGRGGGRGGEAKGGGKRETERKGMEGGCGGEGVEEKEEREG